jgi:type IV pilus assembly protein PilM
MSARELDEAIGWEAEQHIPFPLADVQWRYEPLTSASPGTRAIDVLLVAARRDTVAALAGIVTDAGQRPAVIDVSALALQRAHEASCPSRPGAALAFVDVGASATTVSIVVSGHPAFVRHVPLGGDAYTEGVQRALQVPFEIAEALKKAPDASPHRGAIEAAHRGPTDALVEELRKTIDFFRSTTSAERLGGLVVSGGGSLLPGLISTLGQRLNLPVEPLDAFDAVGGPPGHDAATTSLNARTMGLALGLAMHGEGDA